MNPNKFTALLLAVIVAACLYQTPCSAKIDEPTKVVTVSEQLKDPQAQAPAGYKYLTMIKDPNGLYNYIYYMPKPAAPAQPKRKLAYLYAQENDDLYWRVGRGGTDDVGMKVPPTKPRKIELKKGQITFVHIGLCEVHMVSGCIEWVTASPTILDLMAKNEWDQFFKLIWEGPSFQDYYLNNIAFRSYWAGAVGSVILAKNKYGEVQRDPYPPEVATQLMNLADANPGKYGMGNPASVPENLQTQLAGTNQYKLYDAIKVGNLPEVKKLTAQGADVNAYDPVGRTLLYGAVEANNLDLV